jgi:hypothetical protein
MFVLLVLAVLLVDGCAGKRITVEYDQGVFLVDRLLTLYTEAEGLLQPLVFNGEPIDAAERQRLMTIRNEAEILFTRLRAIARVESIDPSSLITLATRLVEVLPDAQGR